MEIYEIIDIVEYGIRNYRDNRFNSKFTLLEYYSITDIEPAELAKMAYKVKGASSRAVISKFNQDQFWQHKKINMKEKLEQYHSFDNIELTVEDKTSIYNSLVREDFPLVEGVYCRAARYHANNIPIVKDEIRQEVINAYEMAQNRTNESYPKAKVLKK